MEEAVSKDEQAMLGGTAAESAADATRGTQAFPDLEKSKQAAPRERGADAADSVDRKAALATGARRPEPAEPAPAAGRIQRREADQADADTLADKKRRDDAAGELAPEGSAGDSLRRNAQLEPDAWLARIRELIQAGRVDEAKANLAQFRRKYPKTRLPADLRDIR
ncbi:hypothetical protein [Tahibacter amnicola]|uniref:Tetratricopeptide repeat protein n=1 Tax=Tahibacter amnicola TaxID=2976241 RepID=A0ABY6BQD4_9GAMM|nr:hypothetical protein [Tahibacter amnicola]UXI69987.1 hypothetical protein N4264_10280 [Tahibacter amnicola]